MSDPVPSSAPRPAAMDDAFRQELDTLTTTMCRALNDPKRLAIMYLLQAGPLSVGALAEELNAPQANVSQHLAVLRDRGLLDSRRLGTTIEYSLRHPRIIQAIDLLRDVQRQELRQRQDLIGG